MSDPFITAFKAARRASTPLIAVTTQEPASTMRQLEGADPKAPSLSWDLMAGLRARNDAGDDALSTLMNGSDPAMLTNPPEALALASKLPSNSLLFVLQAHRYLANEAVSQAVWNLRDVFKANQRTLVLLGPDLTLPAELSQDVLLLNEPLPDVDQLWGIVTATYAGGNLEAPAPETLDRAVEALRGLSSFAAEQVSAMSLRKDGLNLTDLWLRKKALIDATSGLSVERGSETFADVGGQAQLIEFSDGLMRGRQPVTLIVRVEEIEKSVAGARTDTSGVSQDALQMLLTAMEDEDYTGLIAVGPPGSGKSLYSKALGNTYGVLSVSLDLGGLKGSLVGQSEQAIRTALAVIKSVAGRGGALWVATCNKLDVIPPELRRRFRLGTWFFDLPSDDEKRAIWTLNEARYGLPTNPELRPEDTNYTGSDIRNVCEIAWRLNCSLVDATKYLVPVATLDPEGLASLRKSANGRFLSVSHPGVYREGRTTTDTTRRIAV